MNLELITQELHIGLPQDLNSTLGEIKQLEDISHAIEVRLKMLQQTAEYYRQFEVKKNRNSRIIGMSDAEIELLYPQLGNDEKSVYKHFLSPNFKDKNLEEMVIDLIKLGVSSPSVMLETINEVREKQTTLNSVTGTIANLRNKGLIDKGDKGELFVKSRRTKFDRKSKSEEL